MNIQHRTIQELPDELLFRIFSFLTHTDLIRSVSRVNRRWYTISRSPPMWSSVDFTELRMSNYHLKQLLRRELIGSKTRVLLLRRMRIVIHFHLTVPLLVGQLPSIQKPLVSALKHCTQLQRLCLISGRLKSFWTVAMVLPSSLRRLTLNFMSVERCDAKLEEFHQQLTNLTHLDLTGCGWFADRHLRHLIEGTVLTHLDLNGCYRLFYGPPVCSSLVSRLKLLSERFVRLCPNLIHLGLRSVFTLTVDSSEVETLQDPSLLCMVVESIPCLHSLNLSENQSLIDYISYYINEKRDHEILLPFFRSFFGSKMHHNSTMQLSLYRWPSTCIHAMLSAADSLLTDSTSSKFVIHVDNSSQLQKFIHSPSKIVLQSSLNIEKRQTYVSNLYPTSSTAKQSRLA